MFADSEWRMAYGEQVSKTHSSKEQFRELKTMPTLFSFDFELANAVKCFIPILAWELALSKWINLLCPFETRPTLSTLEPISRWKSSSGGKIIEAI